MESRTATRMDDLTIQRMALTLTWRKFGRRKVMRQNVFDDDSGFPVPFPIIIRWQECNLHLFAAANLCCCVRLPAGRKHFIPFIVGNY